VIVSDGEVEIRYVIPLSPESEQVRFCHLRSDYFTHPDLVRMVKDHILDQIGVAWIPMLAVGRALFGPFAGL
jgi:hypothetical protein